MTIAIFDRMEQATEAEVQRLLPLVSAQRREQALRYKHVFGRFCCLRSWLMLDELMTNNQRPMADWQYNQYGKPYLPEGPFFSISHCKEAIAVAIGDLPIGIDIEGIRHADMGLIERTMSTAEQAQIAEATSADRTFTRLWTQKEAVLKCQGTGIEGVEQLQNVLSDKQPLLQSGNLQTIENDNYIYSIAYGELFGFRP